MLPLLQIWKYTTLTQKIFYSEDLCITQSLVNKIQNKFPVVKLNYSDPVRTSAHDFRTISFVLITAA